MALILTKIKMSGLTIHLTGDGPNIHTKKKHPVDGTQNSEPTRRKPFFFRRDPFIQRVHCSSIWHI